MRSPLQTVPLALALLAAGASFAGPARARPAGGAAPARVAEFAVRQLDVNRLGLVVSNDGRFPAAPIGVFDGITAGTTGQGTGLVYPRGTGTTLMYAGGLWLGGTVAGAARVALAEYSSEYVPGSNVITPILPFDDPRMTVYKVARWTGSPADSSHLERTPAELQADPSLDPLVHHSWSEYMAWAVPWGAPWRTYRLPDTSTPAPGDSVDVPGPDVMGDQMLWCVYNDADQGSHRSPAGGSLPLNVEVRQTLFAYDRPGPLGNTAFVRYEILNRGAATIPDLRVGLWSDPDLGAAQNDLAGCDTTRSLSFAYDPLWSQDPLFGYATPALGFDVLSAHTSALAPLAPPMRSSVEYVNGSDPSGFGESWNLLQGLRTDGTPFVDPATGQPSPLVYPGDPLTDAGWLDPLGSNEKTLVSAGPLSLAPQDTAVVWFAIVVGQGETPGASLVALRCGDDDVQDVFDAGFAEPFAAPRACEPPPTPCPRGADWWAAHCAAGDAFTPAQWEAIARWADSTSVNLGPGSPPFLGPFCAALGAQATVRDSALHELVGLLANAAAADLAIAPAGGAPVGLPLATGVLASPLSGGTVAALFGRGTLHRDLVDARYELSSTQVARELTGIHSGLPLFFGGAGTAAEGSGSGLDPAAMPDSFPTVLLRFDASAGQKAYRYLRLETADGSPPAGGRGYRYAGFRTVPLTAWDLHRGVQLDLAFSERAVTDSDGTLLPPGSQPASFDSTWAPTVGDSGGFERLWVLARPYSPTPHAAFAADGVPEAGTWPALYQLDVRRRFAGGVLDGDGFRFVTGWPATTSADALLEALASASPSDTEAVAVQRQLASSLREVNLGLGIGPACEQPSPFLAELIEASVGSGYVSVTWRLAAPTSAARVEQRTQWGVWLDAGPATLGPGGLASATFALTHFSMPGRYAVRLVVAAAYGVARSDPVWLDVPAAAALAIGPVWPNPSAGDARVSFVLPSGGPAGLEVYDLGGRRVYERELGTLAAGLHVLEIAPGRRFRPGVYFVRLRFGGERRTARFVAL